MASTHQIPRTLNIKVITRDLESGAAIQVTSIIPEEMENRLVEQGLVTRLSYNRVLYPDTVRHAGYTIQPMGEMRPNAYRYARIEFAA